MIILEKPYYIAPKVKYTVLDSQNVLCASGEQYNLPQGIGVANYGTVTDADNNDW